MFWYRNKKKIAEVFIEKKKNNNNNKTSLIFNPSSAEPGYTLPLQTM